ncbi:hypothetical protein P3T39_003058 [Kitasatospora sp. GP82]|nr:hypothetical protein [Kitasatospora sp. GP82]
MGGWRCEAVRRSRTRSEGSRHDCRADPGSGTATRYDHYSVLRTLEDLADLSTHAGNAAATDISGIWD